MILMASDSRNDMPEKHQQVPERFWFLMEVMGFSTTVVNLYSDSCAEAAMQRLSA